MTTPRTQPNLLFLLPDQLRWDWIGCHGGIEVRTPNIDALAGRGVRFSHCRCNSPLCSPSRASLATGRRMHRTGVPDNDTNLHASSLTYMKLLRDAGYHVMASGKTDLCKATAWKGLDGWTPDIEQLGFTDAVNQAGKIDAVNTGWPKAQDPYMAYLHKAGLAALHVEDYTQRMQAARQTGSGCSAAVKPSPLEREHYTDDFCGRSSLALLERAPRGKPWHLWVNFPGPHSPFDPPAELARLYDQATFPDPIQPSPGPDHATIRRHYAAMIEGIDQWVGRIIEAVAQRGELDNTIVIFSADHGEMLGDHHRFGKATWHEPSVRVPLIIAGPGLREGVVSDALVELVDLAATLLDLAGLPTPEDWDARSVSPILHGRTSGEHRSLQVSQLGQWIMACDRRWKYVRTPEGELLFDLEQDPHECRSVNDPQQLARLRQALESEVPVSTRA